MAYIPNRDDPLAPQAMGFLDQEIIGFVRRREPDLPHTGYIRKRGAAVPRDRHASFTKRSPFGEDRCQVSFPLTKVEHAVGHILEASQ